MENNINLTPDAVKAIQALQHPCGTYQFYRAHLDRLFNYILNNSDEIGMSDNEAMHTLRALNALRSDIADIAGTPAQLNEPVDPFERFTLTTEPEQLDEGEEAIKDLNNTLDRLKQATYILKEAGEHAERAGKDDAINSRMAEVFAHFAEAASLIGEMVPLLYSDKSEANEAQAYNTEQHDDNAQTANTADNV